MELRELGITPADAAVFRGADVGEYTGGFRRVPPVLAVEVAGQDEREGEDVSPYGRGEQEFHRVGAAVASGDAVQARLARFLEPLGSASTGGPLTAVQGERAARSIRKRPAPPGRIVEKLDVPVPPY